MQYITVWEISCSLISLLHTASALTARGIKWGWDGGRDFGSQMRRNMPQFERCLLVAGICVMLPDRMQYMTRPQGKLGVPDFGCSPLKSSDAWADTEALGNRKTEQAGIFSAATESAQKLCKLEQPWDLGASLEGCPWRQGGVSCHLLGTEK